MGNSIGGRTKKAKVMKIDGETMKLKTPIQACELIKEYPDHVVLDSEAVKHFGLRAKPLEPQQHLQAKKTYFLLQLPKFPLEDGDHEKKNKVPTRRVQSEIPMGAKDRLELLMLSRRAVSDLSSSTSGGGGGGDGGGGGGGGGSGGPMRVKMRLPRAQLERLVEESKDEVEVAEKIVDLYVERGGGGVGGGGVHGGAPVHGGGKYSSKAREKRVSFAATDEEEILLDKTSVQ